MVRSSRWFDKAFTMRVSLMAQTVKNLPAMQETQVQSLGGEDPLEKGMATHPSIPSWRIPWTEEPGGLESMGSQTDSDWDGGWRKQGARSRSESRRSIMHTNIPAQFPNMRAKSLQSCPTLCSPIDCSPPGSSVHGILQSRILGWVAISFSRGYSQPRDQTYVSCFLHWQAG